MDRSPLDDPARLQALARSELMDSGAEEVFDRLTRLAARLLEAPIALMTLLDQERQYVKSAVGEIGPPVPVSQSFCQYVVESAAPFTVVDVREEPRVADPSALVEADLITYCGVPLTDSDGHTLGSMCAMDDTPREWSENDVAVLQDLAAGAMTELALRVAQRRLGAKEREAQTLRERQDHLARIVEVAEEAIATVDVNGFVTGWNPACERLYGWSADEVLGRPFPAGEIASSVVEGGMSLIARVLAGESVSSRAVLRGRNDGTAVHLDISLTPLRDPGREIVGVTAIARDVTESRRLALELQSSERRFRHTFDHAPSGITLIAPDRTVIDVNRAFCEITGYARDELVGHTMEAITHPEDLDSDVAGVKSMLDGAASSYTVEKRYRHKRGRIVHVALSASLVRAEDGSPAYFIVHTEDVTAAHETQAARREIEDRLRVTVEHAPIGVGLIDLHSDPHGRLLSVNSSLAALLGDPDPVTDGLALTSLLHPEDATTLRADLALLASVESARIEREVRCLQPGGRTVSLLLTGAAVPADDGAPRLAVLHALDIGDRKHFEGQLQHLADHDALTGLINRRRFELELARTVSLAERYHQEGALLMVDLDGFKHVNDTKGHAYGDELITRVASCLRSCLRESDLIGRLGGDEFAVILGSATPESAVAVAEKLLREIAARVSVGTDHEHASVTASVGVAALDPDRPLDADALLIEADLAMYAAKEAGKNRIALARIDGDGRPTLADQPLWLGRLRAALDHDHFELYAQPIRGICAEDVGYYELLLRLRGEDGELIAPGVFLPDAERFDLVQEIDRWVFARALALLATRRDQDIRLSVNMSGRTLNDPRLVDDLTAMVDACPVAPGRLIVEVTETAAIENIERARDVAQTLRALGCRFALDDFGSGFASFYYLKHLAFDFVKIDGEFVRTLGEQPADQLVIGSVVELARGLGAQTIAEFVGDEATVRRLRGLGVDYGQGFHLGRPGPVGEVLPRISRSPVTSPA